MSITPIRLAELMAKHASPPSGVVKPAANLTPAVITSKPPAPDYSTFHGRNGEPITLNSFQQEAVKLAIAGKSFVLIGAAGTGKTTTVQACAYHMEQAGLIPPAHIVHKHFPPQSVPGIAVIAYTRRAVSNIRRAMPANLKHNCLTHHKLLEYEPIFYETTDAVTGESKKTMSFEPTRHKFNPLPASIKVIQVEESSMYSVQLEHELKQALDHEVQFIYLGDIQQLPPTFGTAILGFKMLELPVIELKEVYRQALESPIIRLAHRILSGKPIPVKEFPSWNVPNQLTFHPWKKKIEAWPALVRTAKFMIMRQEQGAYDPEEDVILTPQNVNFGTDDLNRLIAGHFAQQRKEKVYEIIGGIQKLYLAVGDKVLYDKEDAIVRKIEINPLYMGKAPQHASLTLDYFGHEQSDSDIHSDDDSELSDDALNEFLDNVETGDDKEAVRKASHRITLYMQDSDREVTIDKAGEVNTLLLAYALTVHKSQGSEWRRVFLVFHNSQAQSMIGRELLYTAVTRAREELFIICESDTFEKGIINQKIKGNTLEEKAEFFKGKVEQMQTGGLLK